MYKMNRRNMLKTGLAGAAAIVALPAAKKLSARNDRVCGEASAAATAAPPPPPDTRTPQQVLDGFIADEIQQVKYSLNAEPNPWSRRYTMHISAEAFRQASLLPGVEAITLNGQTYLVANGNVIGVNNFSGGKE